MPATKKSEPAPRDDRSEVVSLVGGEGQMLADDLERARLLLRDGMSKIATFVSLLQESVERAQHLASSTGEPAHEDITTELSSIRAEAGRAMLGLQLEDILGQLIEGTRARIGAFSVLSTELAELVSRRPSLAPSVQKLQAELSASREARERTAVDQGSLDPGDTELF